MQRLIERLLTFLGLRRGHPPSGGQRRDPYAWRPVPRRSPPKSRSGAVAVAEPDE
jgi:hypothetical protein